MLIYENILHLEEASKERFIKPLYDKENDLLFADDKINDFVDKQKEGDFCEALIKWVDSGAANKLNINWQSKDTKQLWSDLVLGYYDYVENGGSRKEKKAAYKQNPEELFKAKLKTVYEGEPAENADCMILKSLENSKYIFVVPLNWEACRFMDDARCGGQSAKWCIGYEKEDAYWRRYTDNGSLFILAYSKKPNPPENYRKFMIQIKPQDRDNTKAWWQDDNPTNTISYRIWPFFFNHTADEFIDAFDKFIFDYDNVYYEHASDRFREFDNEYWKDFYGDKYDHFIHYKKLDEYDFDRIIQGDNAGLRPLIVFDDEYIDEFNIADVYKWWHSMDPNNDLETMKFYFEYGHFKKLIWDPSQITETPFSNCFLKNVVIDELCYRNYKDNESESSNLVLTIDDTCKIKVLNYERPLDEVNRDALHRLDDVHSEIVRVCGEDHIVPKQESVYRLNYQNILR